MICYILCTTCDCGKESKVKGTKLIPVWCCTGTGNKDNRVWIHIDLNCGLLSNTWVHFVLFP